tara:strand:- start:3174 stop:4331 length:1158 start_codon:yes stop_codon:yes gene_type:complete
MKAGPKDLVKVIQNVIGKDPAQLHEPSFIGNEKEYLNKCIESTFVSSIGFYVEELEIELAKYTGSKYAILVCNGTSALHLSLRLLGIKENHEVVIPAITFIATANSVLYTGATPHFVDIETESLGIDPIKLRNWLLKIGVKNKKNELVNRKTGKKISAIIPVHVFGHPCKIKEIMKIGEEFNLPIVEDASESLGSFIERRHTGTFGKLGVISFNGNKIITSGGGGAILTDNEELAKRAKHLSTTAKRFHKWEFIHDEVGYNYRMPNLNAALALAQLENIEKFVSKKRKLYLRYKKAFETFENIRVLEEKKGCRSNYWLQTIFLDNVDFKYRDKFLSEAHNNNIFIRPVWNILSNLKPFINYPKSTLTNAIKVEKSTLNIPSSSFL